jgi:hypothetical protein
VVKASDPQFFHRLVSQLAAVKDAVFLLLRDIQRGGGGGTTCVKHITWGDAGGGVPFFLS